MNIFKIAFEFFTSAVNQNSRRINDIADILHSTNEIHPFGRTCKTAVGLNSNCTSLRQSLQTPIKRTPITPFNNRNYIQALFLQSCGYHSITPAVIYLLSYRHITKQREIRCNYTGKAFNNRQISHRVIPEAFKLIIINKEM